MNECDPPKCSIDIWAFSRTWANTQSRVVPSIVNVQKVRSTVLPPLRAPHLCRPVHSWQWCLNVEVSKTAKYLFQTQVLLWSSVVALVLKTGKQRTELTITMNIHNPHSVHMCQLNGDLGHTVRVLEQFKIYIRYGRIIKYRIEQSLYFILRVINSFHNIVVLN